MSKRIIIAGGGTGGHVFPAIAIAHALKKKDEAHEILFVGAKGKLEMEKVPESGYRIIGLDIAGFERSSLIKNIGLPFKVIKSLLTANRIIRDFKPDVVVGVGGYASFPMLFMAQRKKIPTVIQEQNSFAGKTNKLLGKKATAVCVAYDGMERFFSEKKIVITGNPVRSSLFEKRVERPEATAFFGLSENKKTVFVVGGSLGARSINEAIDKNLELLLDEGVQLIWQTGKHDADRARTRTAGKNGTWTGDFITRMDYAYAAADVVISRAGAIAIAELSVMKKAVLFVPFPFAAEDHQTENAKNLVAKKAAMMIPDKEAAEKAIPMIIDLLRNPGLQNELEENIERLAIKNADERIADEIIKSLEHPA